MSMDDDLMFITASGTAMFADLRDPRTAISDTGDRRPCEVSLVDIPDVIRATEDTQISAQLPCSLNLVDTNFSTGNECFAPQIGDGIRRCEQVLGNESVVENDLNYEDSLMFITASGTPVFSDLRDDSRVTIGDNQIPNLFESKHLPGNDGSDQPIEAKHYRNAYTNFYVSLFQKDTYRGKPAREVSKAAGQLWRCMTEAEKKPYHAMTKRNLPTQDSPQSLSRQRPVKEADDYRRPLGSSKTEVKQNQSNQNCSQSSLRKKKLHRIHCSSSESEDTYHSIRTIRSRKMEGRKRWDHSNSSESEESTIHSRRVQKSRKNNRNNRKHNIPMVAEVKRSQLTQKDSKSDSRRFLRKRKVNWTDSCSSDGEDTTVDSRRDDPDSSGCEESIMHSVRALESRKNERNIRKHNVPILAEVKQSQLTQKDFKSDSRRFLGKRKVHWTDSCTFDGEDTVVNSRRDYLNIPNSSESLMHFGRALKSRINETNRKKPNCAIAEKAKPDRITQNASRMLDMLTQNVSRILTKRKVHFSDSCSSNSENGTVDSRKKIKSRKIKVKPRNYLSSSNSEETIMSHRKVLLAKKNERNRNLYDCNSRIKTSEGTRHDVKTRKSSRIQRKLNTNLKMKDKKL